MVQCVFCHLELNRCIETGASHTGSLSTRRAVPDLSPIGWFGDVPCPGEPITLAGHPLDQSSISEEHAVIITTSPSVAWMWAMGDRRLQGQSIEGTGFAIQQLISWRFSGGRGFKPIASLGVMQLQAYCALRCGKVMRGANLLQTSWSGKPIVRSKVRQGCKPIAGLATGSGAQRCMPGLRPPKLSGTHPGKRSCSSDAKPICKKQLVWNLLLQLEPMDA